jgi:hypothetical protein
MEIPSSLKETSSEKLGERFRLTAQQLQTDRFLVVSSCRLVVSSELGSLSTEPIRESLRRAAEVSA